MKNIKLLTAMSAGLMIMPAMAQESIKVGTSTRSMTVYVPKDLPKYNAPLVLSLHGMGQSPDYQRGQTHWDALADTAKIVVVYPQGEGNSWDIGGDKDTKFIEAIIDTMYSRYHINKNRVYVSGFSMGGMMTYHCMSKLSHKIAAFGPVSGIPVDYRNPSGPRPVPIIHIHGSKDSVVKFEGDPNHPAGGYGPIREYVKKWAQFDGCNMTPEVITPYPGSREVKDSLVIYKDGKNGTEVRYVVIDGKDHWHSDEEGRVYSTRELWRFMSKYNLGPEAPVPADVVSVSPENNSFDLKADEPIAFALDFSQAVDPAKATAVLKRGTQTITLKVAETELSKTLTFNLPEGTVLADGLYALNVDNIVNEAGAELDGLSYSYTFGITEVGETIEFTKHITDTWPADQATVGEGIPTGWTRVNLKSDGTEEVTASATANCGGARLKHFTAGGSYDTGFYLSARENTRCSLIYGRTEGHKMHLTPGSYQVKFMSNYWSDGSATGNATFEAGVTQVGAAAAAWSIGSLASGASMAENAAQVVSGAKEHVFDFTIKEEADYEFCLTMAQGWNSVVVGGVTLTSNPTPAQKWKGALQEAIKTGREAYDATAGEDYAASEALRAEVKAMLDKYETFAATAPSAYEAAIAEMGDKMNMLARRKVNVDAYWMAYNKAKQMIEQYAADATISVLGAYINLSRKVTSCGPEKTNMNSDDALKTSTETLSAYTEKLERAIEATPIHAVQGKGEEVLSIQHFDAQGKKVNAETKGLVITRQQLKSGKVKVTKSVK